jgi:[ribosomal protein S5]-alanine N-acetyltransferase
MKSFPTLRTERLVLRAFTLEDAPEVQRLAGVREIAEMVYPIPHPYEDGVAKEWFATHLSAFEAGEAVTFAITLREVGALCGATELTINPQDANAELGYWLGVPYWGRGYATEAAREVVRYGFEKLGLHRIHSGHFARNPASGRVLRKIGMRYEGTRREHLRKLGRFEDYVQYGLLARDWRPVERT